MSKYREEHRSDMLGGEYIDYYDNWENHVGSSRKVETAMGLDSHIEYKDASGNIVGTSKNVDAPLDPHVVFRSPDGEKLTEARKRDSFSPVDEFDDARKKVFENEKASAALSKAREGWSLWKWIKSMFWAVVGGWFAFAIIALIGYFLDIAVLGGDGNGIGFILGGILGIATWGWMIYKAVTGRADYSDMGK